MSRIKKAFLLIGLIQIISFLYINQLLSILKNKKNYHDKSYFIKQTNYKNYKVFKKNEWILNFNVSLYSSIIYYEDDDNRNVIQTESFAFLYRNIEKIDYLKSNLKCLFKMNGSDLIILQPFEIYEINFKRMNYGPKSIWRIKCQLKNFGYDLNQIFLTLVDYKYFDYYEEKLSLNEILMFHKPDIIKKLRPKKRQVAHCLHKVIGLNDQNRFKMLLNWIYMQKEIGIAKIKMCLFDINHQQQSLMKQLFGDFIELQDHKTKYIQVCSHQLLKLHSQPNKNEYKFIYDNCQKLFKIHFNMRSYATFQHQQMICTQDCYSMYRNEYEYVTNYDFDEIILPRLNGYTLKKNLNIIFNYSSNNCEKTQETVKYDIYDMANYLFTKYGKQNAYIKFKQVVFFNDYKSFLKKILTNETTLDENDKNTLSLRYTYRGKYISYKIKPEDQFYFKSFNQTDHYFKCLKSTHMNGSDKILPSIFDNPYATHLIFGREGKSIFNTDLTESYDAHGAKNVTYPHTKHVILPLDVGFVNHFRSNINKYFKIKSYPFNFIKIDVEYYQFLIKCMNQDKYKKMSKTVVKYFKN